MNYVGKKNQSVKIQSLMGPSNKVTVIVTVSKCGQLHIGCKATAAGTRVFETVYGGHRQKLGAEHSPLPDQSPVVHHPLSTLPPTTHYCIETKESWQ